MKIFFVGDIVGKCGEEIIKKRLKKFKEEKKVDFIIAQGDRVSNGYSIIPQGAVSLISNGVNCIVGGENTFISPLITSFISSSTKLLRGSNYPTMLTPGKGWHILKIGEERIMLINLVGVINSRQPLNSPFSFIDCAIEKINKDKLPMVVTFIGSTTAEKQTFYNYTKGKVATVIGMGGDVQTSDYEIQDGTAYMTDIGLTGSSMSVCGVGTESVIEGYLLGHSMRTTPAFDSPKLQGLIVEINNGKATDLEVINEGVVLN